MLQSEPLIAAAIRAFYIRIDTDAVAPVRKRSTRDWALGHCLAALSYKREMHQQESACDDPEIVQHFLVVLFISVNTLHGYVGIGFAR